ncbi:MauE/DoxX family redox-associated membrane protein [Carbonactinospora thermoautotrophica]|uniref:MauE/DoxX family redox-associated membrane protein n=1 Tax=Carbonactinospora thermoautotrophica TaxID=1469144 RepID=UPI00226DDCE7|nr:MauE/DoxX family redox-associated membrane protein [Carbonactinospora thermoautotrophica]
MAHAASVLTAAGALLLVTAGINHLRNRRTLRAALAAHRLLPAAALGAVARLLGGVELVVGGVTVVAMLGYATPVRLAAAGQALLYAGLAGYLVALVRRRPGAGCGPLAANELTVTRAVVLAFAGLVVVVLPYALRPASSADALLTWGTVVVLAALLVVADARQRSRRVCV